MLPPLRNISSHHALITPTPELRSIPLDREAIQQALINMYLPRWESTPLKERSELAAKVWLDNHAQLNDEFRSMWNFAKQLKIEYHRLRSACRNLPRLVTLTGIQQSVLDNLLLPGRKTTEAAALLWRDKKTELRPIFINIDMFSWALGLIPKQVNDVFRKLPKPADLTLEQQKLLSDLLPGWDTALPVTEKDTKDAIKKAAKVWIENEAELRNTSLTLKYFSWMLGLNPTKMMRACRKQLHLQQEG